MSVKRSKSESLNKEARPAKQIKSYKQKPNSPKRTPNKVKYEKKFTPGKKKGQYKESDSKTKDEKPVLEKSNVEKKNKTFLKQKGKKNFTELPKKLIGKDGKPQWNQVKIEKKKLKENRKVHNAGEDQYQLSVKAKSIWEKLRIKKLSADKKESLVNDLFMLLKGQLSNCVHSHDMTRVVQWMLKLGSATVRTAICEELCANTPAYLQSKYARYCVKRALRYGTKADRDQLIQSCNGHFLRLLAHSFSSPIVEVMYTMFASLEQRKLMHRELYGEMHALIPEGISTIKKIPKDIRPAILAATKTNLIKLLAKKELLKSTLLQSVLNDFLTNCSDEDRVEISEHIQGDILELTSSKEGCRVALLVIWSATNKIKKVIVKSLKGKIIDIATSEIAHIILMALFDSMDDTVLIKKALIPELVSQLDDLAKDQFGRRVILYLVAHRDPAYFHPQQIEILCKGDIISKRKKDPKIREQEMLEAVSGPLLQRIANDPALWFGESSVSMVSLAIMKSGKGAALHEVFEKLVEYILSPNSMIEVNKRQCQAVEHGGLHLVLKKLIQQDQARLQSSSETFSSVLVSKLSEESLNQMMQFNRGCFLLVLLFESENPTVCKVLKSKLTKPLKALLEKQETTGAKILLKKLGGTK